MENDVLSLTADALLLKIHVMQGWTLQENDILQAELSKQFALKMRESYPTLNALEVEYAFRTYGADVKDWGKNLNLSLIDEVVRPYLIQRAEISKMEERLKLPEMKLKNEIKEETPEEKLAEIERYKNLKPRVLEIPPYLYGWLLEFGMVNPDKKAVFKRAKEMRKVILYDACTGRADDQMAFDNYLEQYKADKFDSDELNRLRLLAKKIVVHDYLNQTP